MAGKQVRAEEVIRQSLPPLLRGTHHTTSSAPHDLRFTGPLRRWSGFLGGVKATCESQNWSNKAIKYTQQSGDFEAEAVYVGNEHGVQHRFQQSVGQILGTVLDAQSIDLHFADFKCLGSPYTKTPHAIVMDSTNDLKIVGDIKVPWVDKHEIGRFYMSEAQLRVILAQLIDYMQDLNCMYGFLSNYDETIFLRQHLVNGSWEVDYSPVIDASTSYVESNPDDLLASPIVSVKQCFFYVASFASMEGQVFNTTPKSQWVVPRS